MLEICENEEKRRDLEKKIREYDERIEMKKQVQEESVTVTSSVLVIRLIISIMYKSYFITAWMDILYCVI